MANGDEWALDGPGWEEGQGEINDDLSKPWLGPARQRRELSENERGAAEHDAAEMQHEYSWVLEWIWNCL